MPANVQGSPYSGRLTDLARVEHSYSYPDRINLKPGSVLHEKIRDAVYRRAEESYRVMQNRFDSWNKLDETLTAYIYTDDYEQRIQEKDERKPVSIVVPYSYATLETLLTYLIAAYLQDPVFRYEGVSPEDSIGAILLELVISLQCNRFKVGLPLHTMFRDCLVYGIGPVAVSWETIRGYKTRYREQPVLTMFGMGIGKKMSKVVEEAVLFEGNTLTNINPYFFLPDPNYGIQEIQKGDFVGWIDTVSLMDMLTEEKDDEDCFNAKYLKSLATRRSSLITVDPSAVGNKTGVSRDLMTETLTKPVDRINMFMKIIPKEFGLPGNTFNPSGEYPEKWFFQLSGDQIVTKAQPIGLDHDMYPVSVAAPDYDGRTITPISRLEMVYGLQHVLNFLFNSHITNVRKAINDMLIVDPSRIHVPDLEDPGPGGIIRLKRKAWGKSALDAITQLKVTDITAQNVADARQVIDIMERCSAATHNLMGVMRPGSERRSAAEFEGTQGSALNRLERMAKIIGIQSMQDIGYMYASHTQQFQESDTYISSVGEYEKRLLSEFGFDNTQNGRMKVTPSQLSVDYDVKVRDGSVPGGNFSQAWVQLYQAVGASPILASRIDTFRLFKHIARNLGAKNIEEFELKQPSQQMQQMPPMQANVMPDEEVAQQAQAGNIIPVNQLQ